MKWQNPDIESTFYRSDHGGMIVWFYEPYFVTYEPKQISYFTYWLVNLVKQYECKNHI